MSLGIRTGHPTEGGCTFVACSDRGDNVTVTIKLDGVTAAVITIDVMVKMGADHSMITPPPDGLDYVAYVGNKPVTGLQPFTQYTYDASNGFDALSGSFYTAPKKGDDFSVAFATCLNAINVERSIYDFIEWYRVNGALPLIAAIHTDDIIYSDALTSVSVANGSLSKAADPDVEVALSEYNWCLNYTALYGCLPDAGNRMMPVNNPNYQSVGRNTHFIPQAGDHEYFNDPWQTVPSYPNAMHLVAGQYDGPACVAFDAYMKPLMGDIIAAANPDSQHWSLTLGDLQIVALDVVRNCIVTGTPGTSGTTEQYLGMDQISEVLGALNNHTPLKILASGSFTLRDGIGWAGYKQQPGTWSTFVAAERNRLFLDDSAEPKSIMKNNYTNGVMYPLVVIRGDAHGDPCFYFSNPASTGLKAEGYHDICLVASNGGRGGSIIGTAFTHFTDNEEPGNFPYLVGEPGTQYSGGTAWFGTRHEACVIVEVYGSRNPPEMVVRRYDRDWRGDTSYSGGVGHVNFANNFQFIKGEVAESVNEGYLISFERKFAPLQGNYGFDLDEETWRSPRVCGGGA